MDTTCKRRLRFLTDLRWIWSKMGCGRVGSYYFRCALSMITVWSMGAQGGRIKCSKCLATWFNCDDAAEVTSSRYRNHDSPRGSLLGQTAPNQDIVSHWMEFDGYQKKWRHSSLWVRLHGPPVDVPHTH